MNNNREKLVDNIDIVDEISSCIELEPKGRNYVGLCPFHADNNPSFTVNSEKKIYKCFVCGEGGDVVKFYKTFHHVSNGAAIEELAKKYKVAIKLEQFKQNYLPVNHLLNDINKFYVTALHSTEGGEKSLEYLKARGFSIDTINHFHLGYGYTENDKLYQYLEKKIEVNNNYSESDIEQIKQFNNKRDLFVSRITIPILQHGNVVGFGGRALTKNPIKYLNSKDSNIFKKKEVLYHFDEALKLSPDRSLIVVEGFFDVIKAFQFNIKNAVALMGTSFSINHIKKMKQSSLETIYLALDNDTAGQSATLNIGRLLVKNQFNVKVIKWPSGKDLDEYLLDHSHEDFQTLKKNSINFKLFEMDTILESPDITSIDEKNKAINEIIDNLYLENDLVIEQILSKLSTSFNVSKEFLNTKLIENKEIKYEPVEVFYPENEINEVFQKQVVNRSNISFMSIQQLIIYRSISSKSQFIELKKYKQQANKQFGIYESLFNTLDIYYNKFSKFDYVTFTNNYPQFALLIDELYEKEIIENNVSNQELIGKIKNNTSWGIFKR